MRGACLILTAAVLLGLSQHAGAAEAAPGAGRVPVFAAAPGEGAEKAGEESAQLNPFAPALDLTIWTIVVFGLMLLVLWRFAWGPILKGLQGREKAISDAIEQAKRDRDDAERMRAQLQQELNTAAEKVRAMLDEARRDGQQLKDEMRSAAQSEIQTEKERLRREIDLAKDQALQDIWTRTVELATALSSTTVRRRLSPDDHRALVDDVLNELGDAGTQWKRRGGQSA